MSYTIECPPTIREGALITFIGESPGGQEVNWHECPRCGYGIAYSGLCKQCGIPRVRKPQGFVGGSGNLLRRACRNAGVPFDLCNRSNVAKRRPPGDKFELFYLDKQRKKPTEELLWWRELLLAELRKYRPNFVVAAGNEALRVLCPGHDGITKWHGSILISDVLPGLKVIPILHPAYIMRDNWEWYYILIRQLKESCCRIQRASHTREGGRRCLQYRPYPHPGPGISGFHSAISAALDTRCGNCRFVSPMLWTIILCPRKVRSLRPDSEN